ncbi:mucin-2-like [Physella acuta]|uniref:mucin-2-like n=1 Tax=Physella acuta TaxID=109671 RepID=UPI0027DBFC3D|nr:mucin-2-like [Physella acuta]
MASYAWSVLLLLPFVLIAELIPRVAAACNVTLTSVKVELPPVSVSGICHDGSGVALVIACGDVIWVEKVPDLCRRGQNHGAAQMRRALPAPTVTIQLVQGDAVLDAARVNVTQTSRQYNILVVGQQNTRFVLSLESQCIAPHTEDSSPNSGEASSDFLPSTINMAASGDSKIRLPSRLPEFVHKNKLLRPNDSVAPVSRPTTKRSQTVTTSKKSQTVTTSNRSQSVTSSKRSQTVTSRKSQSVTSKDKNRFATTFPGDVTTSPTRERATQVTSPDNPASLELDKLKWMEDQRQLFELRRETVRRLYPGDGDYNDYSPGGDDVTSTHTTHVPVTPPQDPPHLRSTTPATILLKPEVKQVINLKTKNQLKSQLDAAISAQVIKPAHISFRTLNNPSGEAFIPRDITTWLPQEDSRISVSKNETADFVFLNAPQSTDGTALSQRGVTSSPLNNEDAGVVTSSPLTNEDTDVMTLSPLTKKDGGVMKSLPLTNEALTEADSNNVALFFSGLLANSENVSSVAAEIVPEPTSGSSNPGSGTEVLITGTTGEVTSPVSNLPTSSHPQTTVSDSDTSPLEVTTTLPTPSTTQVTSTTRLQDPVTSAGTSTTTQTTHTTPTTTIPTTVTRTTTIPTTVTRTTTIPTTVTSTTTTPTTRTSITSAQTTYISSTLSGTRQSSTTSAVTTSTPSPQAEPSTSPSQTSSPLEPISPTLPHTDPTTPPFPFFTLPFPTNLPSGVSTNTNTSSSDDAINDDAVWPVVAALVVGIPAVIVIGIAVVVIQRRSQPTLGRSFQMRKLPNNSTPKLSVSSDTIRSTMMHSTSIDV